MAKRSILSKTYFDGKFSAVGGGSGGNPTGGTIDVATTNYLATLFQQWIAMTLGSASAVRMNLLNCLIEPFRLYASTNFYAWANAYTNGINDYLTAFSAATGTYLDGYVSPAHLKMSLHANGTGNYPASNPVLDNPIYNSINSVSSWQLSGINSGIHVLGDMSGAIITYSSQSSNLAIYAFDGKASTGWQGNTGTAQWLKCDFGAGNEKLFTSFYMKTLGSGDGTSFTLAGSNNDSDWTTLATFDTMDNVLSFSNSTAYRYYRISTPINWIIYAWGVTDISPVEIAYDTVDYNFGTSSLKFYGGKYLSGAASNINYLKLYNKDWHFRSLVKLTATNKIMTMLSVLGKQLEIQIIPTGLRVNYSTNGTTFTTINSSAIIWDTDWHFVSIRRTGNTLYFYVDNVAYGVGDLTDVTLFETSTNSYYIGADSTGNNLFAGNMEEVEFFVGESIEDTAPVAARSTAYVPTIAWQSSAQYINSNATSLFVLFFLDEVKFSAISVPTLNTDLVFQVSINNGSNWYPVTLTKVGMLTVNTGIYKGTLDLTGKANTNQLKYQIDGSNNKPVKFDGLLISWN